MTLLLALALGAAVPLPIQYVTKTADVIAIAEVVGGGLKIERLLKGKPAETLSLVPNAELPVRPGDRALFFLFRGEGEAFEIYRKLPLSSDGKTVERPHTVVMSTICIERRCPLTEVLSELKPWLGKTEPTAFITAAGSLTHRPSSELKCKPSGGLTLECGKDGEPPDMDLLCFEKQAQVICFRTEPPK